MANVPPSQLASIAKDLAGGQGKQSVRPADIPIEHLEYTYVDTCTNTEELKAILEVLQSGREGKYPHLEKHVENKLLSLMSPTERSQYIALHSEPSHVERVRARTDVIEWLEEMARKDAASAVPLAPGPVPATKSAQAKPVRGLKAGALASAAGSTATVGAQEAARRDPKAEPFSEYYAKWDKIAADVADGEEDGAPARGGASSAGANAEQARPGHAQASGHAKTEPVESMSAATREALAQREKTKGNEFLRSGDTEAALRCYSKSLEYDATSTAAAVVFSNRAQAHIMLKNWQSAENDADAAVRLDPTYAKGWIRRGNARMKRGKYGVAAQDFSKAIDLQPGATIEAEVKKLMTEAERLHKDVEAPASRPQSTSVVSAPGPLPAPVAVPAKGRRLIIEEESPEEEEAERIAATPAPVAVGAAQFRRVQIVEEDEEVPVHVSAAASAPAPHAAAHASTTPASAAPSLPTPTTAPAAAPAETSTTAQQSGAAAERSATLTAEARKKDGNAHVAAGRFAEAVTSYTRALEALPSDATSERAAILNNRAMARLKLEQWASCASDATECLTALGVDALATAGLAMLACAESHVDVGDGSTRNRLLGISLKVSEQEAAVSQAQHARDALWQTPAGGGTAPCGMAVKALFRRATAEERQGYIADALRDCAAALCLQPQNPEVRDALRRLKASATAASRTPPAESAAAPRPAPATAVSAPAATARPVDAAGVTSPAKPLVSEVAPVAAVAGGSPAIDARLHPSSSAKPVSAPALPDAVAKTSIPAPRTPGELQSAALAKASAAAAKLAAAGGARHTPPRTSLELERQVTSLRKAPRELFDYLRNTLTGESFRQLFRRPVEPDLFLAIVSSLHQSFAAGSAERSESDREWLAAILAGLGATPSVGTTVSMLTPDEKRELREVVGAARGTSIPPVFAGL